MTRNQSKHFCLREQHSSLRAT